MSVDAGTKRVPTQDHLIPNLKNLEHAIKIADELLVKGVLNEDSINQPLPNGRLPLHLAILENQPKIVSDLLEKGADPELRDINGLNAFDHAALMQNKEITALLLSKVVGIYQDYIDGLLKNPASTSAMNALKAKTDKLIAVDVKTLTPLCRAAYEGNLDEIRKLGGDLNKLDKFGKSPLHYTILGKRIKAFNLLIEKGADVKICTSEGDSALHLAALTGSSFFIKELIKRDLNPNLPNKQGQTPLHYAAAEEKFTAIKCLIVQGARPTIQDNQKICPLSLIGTSALQRDPLALSKTQVLLFAISMAYWTYYLAQTLGLQPETLISAEIFPAHILTGQQLATLFGGSWATFGTLFTGSTALFQAFHTYDVVSSAFKGLKACWDNLGYRNWTVARNVVVHTANITSSLGSLWQRLPPVFPQAPEISTVVRAKFEKLSEVDRILSPSLNPTNAEEAALIFSPEFDFSKFQNEGMSYLNKGFYRKLSLKYHPDRVKGLSQETAQDISARLNLAKTKLETWLENSSLSARLKLVQQKFEAWFGNCDYTSFEGMTTCVGEKVSQLFSD